MFVKISWKSWFIVLILKLFLKNKKIENVNVTHCSALDEVHEFNWYKNFPLTVYLML